MLSAQLPSLLLHFWQEIPEHMLPLLEQPIVVSLIKHCDTILYSTIVDVLLPSSMQEVSDRFVSLVLLPYIQLTL